MNTKYLGLKILEHNGFEPDEETLALVEANLVDILEDRDVVLTEGATEDDYYRHVLDKNGYTMTDRNVKILKEGLETGKFLIYNLNEEEAEFLMEDKKGGTGLKIDQIKEIIADPDKDNSSEKKKEQVSDKEDKTEDKTSNSDKTEDKTSNPNTNGQTLSNRQIRKKARDDAYTTNVLKRQYNRTQPKQPKQPKTTTGAKVIGGTIAGAAGAAAGAVGGMHTAKRLGIEASKAHDALVANKVNHEVAGKAIKAGGGIGAGIAAGAIVAGVAANHAKKARIKKQMEAKEKAKQQNI